jgi:hypothetical protein
MTDLHNLSDSDGDRGETPLRYRVLSELSRILHPIEWEVPFTGPFFEQEGEYVKVVVHCFTRDGFSEILMAIYLKGEAASLADVFGRNFALYAECEDKETLRRTAQTRDFLRNEKLGQLNGNLTLAAGTFKFQIRQTVKIGAPWTDGETTPSTSEAVPSSPQAVRFRDEALFGDQPPWTGS